MDFGEKEMREQAQAFAALKDEFSRLNARFDGMCKDAGLSGDDLRKTLEGQLAPDMEKALNQAKEEAARAGQMRADQARVAGPARAAGTSARGGRRGAVKI